jgi:DNA topoisomerase-2
MIFLFRKTQITPETGKRNGSFIVTGKIDRLDDTTLFISELPIRKWTQDYKEFLEALLIGKPTGDAKGKETTGGIPEIKDFKENHTDTTVSFTITADKAKIDEFEREKNGLYGKFKLTGTLSTSNMTLFDTSNRLVKYTTPEDIFSIFYDIRLDFYVKRKTRLVKNLRTEQMKLSNKARFVEEVCTGELVVSNRKRTEILQELQDKGYDTFAKETKTSEESASPDDEEEAPDTSSDANVAKGYEYLLGMKIWSLTFEKAEELRKQLEEKNQALLALEATSPSQIWINDLDAIEVALDEREVALQEEIAGEMKAQKKNAKHQAKQKTQKKGTKKKKGEWDSDNESSSEEEGDDGMDSDTEMAQPKKAASRPRATVKATKPKVKKAPATKAPATKVSTAPSVLAHSILEDLDATAAAKAAPKAATKAAAKPAKKAAAPAPKAPESDSEKSDSDNDMLGPSLLERMRTKMVVSPAGKKPAARKTETTKMIDFAESDAASVESDQDFLAELDSNSFVPAALTPARKKAVKSTQAKKKPVAAKKTTVAAAKKTQKSIELCDSDSDDFDFNSDEEEQIAKKPVAARARAGRNASKKIVYDFSDNEDDDSDSGFE